MPPKGERRKQQIIETAKEMFMDKGFQSTHIGQVCEELDIARGTVYQYFSNKKEILYTLLDTVIENIEDILDTDDLREFLDKNPAREVIIDFLRERITSSITVLINEPIVIKLIFKDIVGIDDDVVDRVNISVARIMSLMGREIEELKKNGIFKQELDARITSSMLVGGIMLLVYEFGKRKRDILEAEVVEAIVFSYLNGAIS